MPWDHPGTETDGHGDPGGGLSDNVEQCRDSDIGVSDPSFEYKGFPARMQNRPDFRI